jgi:hypothetical protein
MQPIGFLSGIRVLRMGKPLKRLVLQVGFLAMTGNMG